MVPQISLALVIFVSSRSLSIDTYRLRLEWCFTQEEEEEKKAYRNNLPQCILFSVVTLVDVCRTRLADDRAVNLNNFYVYVLSSISLYVTIGISFSSN